MEKSTMSGPMGIVLKAMVVHTITYFVIGGLAYAALDYQRFFRDTELRVLMRPTDDPWVMAGPLFQPLRGLLFGLVFATLREPLFASAAGFWRLWFLLAGLGILNTFGPAPGSIEGLIYTLLPWKVQLYGLPEVIVQSGLFAAILSMWVRRPGSRAWTGVLVVAFILCLALPILGLTLCQAGQ